MGILIKPTIASILMAIVCYFSYMLVFAVTNMNTLSTIIAICLGGVFYFVALALVRGLRKEDLDLMPGGRRLAGVLKRYRLI